MSSLPDYYTLYLQIALAKFLAIYKGRIGAWTPELQEVYITLKNDMEAQSSQNLSINTNQDCWLNGAYRVRAGI